jgi:NAD(P)-dependent dehydrogenase (short-subunit alcohol dehydrogenase family)
MGKSTAIAFGAAAIVNNSSVLGLKGVGSAPLYSTMKHGVVGLTKSAALQYGEDGIRVNAVCPGWIDTEMTAGWVEDPDMSSMLHSMQAIKRHGEGEEIAGIVLWLCSDSASFTTGATFVVDGGLLA